jgi:hypothetical protein
MTDLVATLSTGKGTWITVNKLINSGDFEKIYLITNQWTKENYKNEKNAEMIVVDNFAPVPAMTAIIIHGLKEKLRGTEVALNLTSGTGNEHMATLSALLKLGFAIRLVTYANDKVEEI